MKKIDLWKNMIYVLMENKKIMNLKLIQVKLNTFKNLYFLTFKSIDL